MAPEVEIVVIGDLHWDTVFLRLPGDHNNPPQPKYVRIVRPGGAWLLQSLIETATNIKVKGYIPDGGIEALRDHPSLGQDKCHHALTVMELFPKDAEKKEEVYRIRQTRSYGWVAYAGEGGCPWTENEVRKRPDVYNGLNSKLKDRLETNPAHRIVIVSETKDHIFGDLPGIGNFVAEVAGIPNSTLVLSMANPLGENELWKWIKGNSNLLDRTLLIFSAAALREAWLYIREHGALETIAHNLTTCIDSSSPVFQMNKNKCAPLLHKLRELIEHRELLIRSGSKGVFHFNKNQQSRLHLYSLPFEGGEPPSDPGHFGHMRGYGKILMASIVRQMAKSIKLPLDNDNLRIGISDGLKVGEIHFGRGFARKALFEEQYLKNGKEPDPFGELFRPDTRDKKQRKHVALLHAPLSERELRSWNRVDGFRERGKCLSPSDFDVFLSEVVKYGLGKTITKECYKEAEGIISLPFLMLGDLISIDRAEIDDFSDIYRLIQIYVQDNTRMEPLSLAVFGPPGTGKSFAVKEILKAAGYAPTKSDILVYNLAEFTDPKNLTIAFRQAQDKALSKEVPLVFFDEFDASLPDHKYAWLKYFLAPMQDGKFKGAETEGSYRVGKAIFVFAGGTAETFEDFKAQVAKDGVRNAKGPDFISRLRGHLNIKGINKENREAKEDDRLVLRRAIILRSILEKKAKDILDDKKGAMIKEQVIRAFLRIERDEHGIRSMEAIVEMSNLENGQFLVTSLPSSKQLGMHVDADRFLELAW